MPRKLALTGASFILHIVLGFRPSFATTIMHHLFALAFAQMVLPIHGRIALINTQAPLADDVLAAGSQTLPSPSATVQNTGVRLYFTLDSESKELLGKHECR